MEAKPKTCAANSAERRFLNSLHQATDPGSEQIGHRTPRVQQPEIRDRGPGSDLQKAETARAEILRKLAVVEENKKGCRRNRPPYGTAPSF